MLTNFSFKITNKINPCQSPEMMKFLITVFGDGFIVLKKSIFIAKKKSQAKSSGFQYILSQNR